VVFSLAYAQPDAREIIRRSVLANDADWKALPNYSHRETDITEKVGATGEPKSSKTAEVLMIDGSPYWKLIAVNDKPVSTQEREKEEAKLKKEIARRKRETGEERASRIEKFIHERQNEHLLMNEMINAFDFKLVGEQQLNGHPVYVLEATPRRDYHPLNQKAKVLAGMKGKLWVDKEHYHWVKVEAEVIHPVNFGWFLAKVDPGTRFEFEQSPVGSSSVWLPKSFAQVVNSKILGMISYRTREEELYTDYRPAGDQLTRR
jgi:hypothetical protein